MAFTVDNTCVIRFIRMGAHFSARASGYSKVAVKSSRGAAFKTFSDIGHDRTSRPKHLVRKGEFSPPALALYHFSNRADELPGLLPGMKVLESFHSAHNSKWTARPQIPSSFPRAIGLKKLRSFLHPAPCTLHSAPCTLHSAPCTLHLVPCTLHPAPCTLHPVLALYD